jgi:hypothetical protein
MDDSAVLSENEMLHRNVFWVIPPFIPNIRHIYTVSGGWNAPLVDYMNFKLFA